MERKSAGYKILTGVILEAHRLNRGSRLVPACNTELIHGNYWILHHLSELLSLFLLHTVLCLSDSLCPCNINLLCQFWCFTPISTPFSSFLFTFHLLMPHCLVSSHHGLFFLFIPLVSSGSLWWFCSYGQGLNAALEMIILLFLRCFFFYHPL